MNDINFMSLSLEDRAKFLKDTVNQHHKDLYLQYLQDTNTKGPSWEDLSQEERDKIIRINEENSSKIDLL